MSDPRFTILLWTVCAVGHAAVLAVLWIGKKKEFQPQMNTDQHGYGGANE